MPGAEHSLAVTEAYRARLLNLRARTIRVAAIAWRQVTLDDLPGSYRAWLQLTAAVVTTAQRQGIILSEAYVAAFVASELGRAQPVVRTGLEETAGAGQDGRSLLLVLAPPLLTIRAALRRGVEPDRALEMGLARASRTVGVEVAEASHRAVNLAARRDTRVIGWRRATGPNPCGACLGAADGEIHRFEEPLEGHPYDRCVRELVVRGVRDRHARPTGQQLFDGMTVAQQNALFHGRGGRAKAELIRSGRASLADLVHRSPRRIGPDVITETPLAALTA